MLDILKMIQIIIHFNENTMLNSVGFHISFNQMCCFYLFILFFFPTVYGAFLGSLVDYGSVQSAFTMDIYYLNNENNDKKCNKHSKQHSVEFITMARIIYDKHLKNGGIILKGNSS